jgi:thiol-disulfide isomerase/thioredoxin
MVRLVFVSSLVLALSCAKRASAPIEPPPGYPEGDFQLTLKRYTEKTDWNLKDDLGSVVVLDIWATWCEPCRDSLPRYQELLKKHSDKGLKVYAVNVDADASQIPKFLMETKVSVPILLDLNAQAAESTLRVKVMPTAFFIDKKGHIRHVHEGFAEELYPKYVAEVEALLAQP